MKTTWLKGVEADQHDRVKSAFTSSSELRARLTKICEDKVYTIMSTHKSQYDSPNWAYAQADAIGYRRALEEIISLIEN